MHKAIAAAQSDPRLIPFAVAISSTLMANPIFQRSNSFSSGYDHICDSQKGGGQGNALTGQIYVLSQNDSLKAVESQFGVTVKAVHDDIAIYSAPGVMFGTDGDDGALGFLIDKLEGDCGLTINRSKCAVFGTTPDACAPKPTWLPEPTSFKDDNGVLVETGARGIVICQNPIGEINFVQTFLHHKFQSICSVINKSFSTLLLKDKHVAFQAFYYSLQARFDFWLSTNLPSHNGPLAIAADISLKNMLDDLAGASLFTPLEDGSPFDSLTGERALLGIKHSGLGFRPLENRALFLNSTNLTIPQTIDRRDDNGIVIPGLWNSLSRYLGVGSFDATNGDTCWNAWHSSGSSLGTERLASIVRIKVDHTFMCQTLAKDASEDPVFSKSDDGFGYGVGKLHRTITGKLRDLKFAIFGARVRSELAQDDQRRIAFEAADIFANSFPISIDLSNKFSQSEFVTALQRKFGLPLYFIRNRIGELIAANGGSRRLRVDPFGVNVAAAPGVPGDHFRITHDAFLTFAVGKVKEVGIPARGGGYGSLKGIFSKNINQSNVSPEDQQALNGIIPDGSSDGRAVPQLENHVTSLNDRVVLWEVKGLSTQSETVQARASRIDPDIDKAAADLDAKYPGSTVLQEKKKYGKDGKYLALVTGSLGNFSSDVLTLVEFIASVQTVHALQWRTTSSEQLFGMYRRFLVSSFGLFASRLWARHIHDKFRDAVAVTGPSNAPQFPDPDLEIIRDFHLGNFRANRAQRHGSRRGV